MIVPVTPDVVAIIACIPALRAQVVPDGLGMQVCALRCAVVPALHRMVVDTVQFVEAAALALNVPSVMVKVTVILPLIVGTVPFVRALVVTARVRRWSKWRSRWSP